MIKILEAIYKSFAPRAFCATHLKDLSFTYRFNAHDFDDIYVYHKNKLMFEYKWTDVITSNHLRVIDEHRIMKERILQFDKLYKKNAKYDAAKAALKNL